MNFTDKTKSSLASLTVSLVLLVSAGMTHASTPYSGTPIAIPGTIEAEDYDLGGEGDAYHDTSAGNTGGGYRPAENVDIEACSDSGGGFNVGWTVAGEWLKYTVDVVASGNYTITTRVATEVATGAFHIEVDGVDVTGSIAVPNTGNWQAWQPVTAVAALTAGQRVVRLVIESGDININRFDFALNGPGPAAPTGLQVDSSGDNFVSLSWTASASGSPTSYNVKRATSSGGPYSIVGTAPAPTVTFTDSVTGGATYYYVVSGVNANGEGDDSSPAVSATPTLGEPDAPVGLAASPGDNQVALTWGAPAVGSPTSYNVKRSTTSGSGYATITAPGTQITTSYTDTTAVNGTPYYYVVSAVNAAGEGANSAEADATPNVFTGIYEPFDYPVESPLLNGTSATADGFTSWTCGTAGWILPGLTYSGLPVANNAMRSSAGSRQFVGLADPLSTGTKWISFLFKTSVGNSGANINGVYFPNGGTGLFFGMGLNPYSATQGYLGLGSMNTVGTTPQAATLLKQLTLGTYGATYLVVLKIDFDTSGSSDTVTVYINPATNQPTPGVEPAGTHSTFNVGTITGVGSNVSGGGEIIIDEIRIANTYTDAVDAIVTPPAAPTGLNATPGPNQVSLSWTAAAGSPTSYNVKRSTASGGPYTLIATRSAPTVSYTDSILGGTTYFYVVSAVNAIGESADSAYVAAAAILAPPAAPGGLSATPGDAQVSLSWSPSSFATSYDVKRASDFGGPYASIGTTTGLTLTDSGLLNARTYFYVVAALGDGGSSPDTSPVSATPFGPLPLVLTIEPGVGITWFASSNVTYQVQWASEDLGTNTVWNNLGSPIIGDDTTITVFEPLAPQEAVYQVISY
ncbi:MAG: fibronectin type III domain-containing protein [Oceanipulchritudo sp.]